HHTKINKEGYFVVKNDVTRYQQTNLADGLETIRNIIRKLERKIETKPSPETVEKLRRRHEKATMERLMVKRHRSMIKSDRQNQ
ncbi:Peptidyl-tRNA hydrolase ICT1, mitochondrial, partial [Pseudolycoriella hygida]